MESNISRDQVQLEVLCALIKAHTVKHQTIWNRIGSALGLCKPRISVTAPNELVSESFALTAIIMDMRNVLGDLNVEDIAKRLQQEIENRRKRNKGVKVYGE